MRKYDTSSDAALSKGIKWSVNWKNSSRRFFVYSNVVVEEHAQRILRRYASLHWERKVPKPEFFSPAYVDGLLEPFDMGIEGMLRHISGPGNLFHVKLDWRVEFDDLSFDATYFPVKLKRIKPLGEGELRELHQLYDRYDSFYTRRKGWKIVKPGIVRYIVESMGGSVEG